MALKQVTLSEAQSIGRNGSTVVRRLPQGVKLPEVKLLSTGLAISEDQARELAIKPMEARYKYNGAEWTILLDPLQLDAEAEKEMRAVQMEMFGLREVVRSAAGISSDAEAANAAISMSDEDRRKMMDLQERLTIAQIKMCAPCVLDSNDPLDEHFPTFEMLSSNTILGDAQWGAISDVLFPSSFRSTDTAKSSAPNTSAAASNGVPHQKSADSASPSTQDAPATAT